MDENRSFHWEFDDSLRFLNASVTEKLCAFLPRKFTHVRIMSDAPCGLEKKYLTWFIPKRYEFDSHTRKEHISIASTWRVLDNANY